MAHGLSRELLDAHVHLWDLALTPQPWIDPVAMSAIARDFGAGDLADQLGEVGREHGADDPDGAARSADASPSSPAIAVTGAVVVQADHSLDETRWLLDAASASTAVAAVVGWVDLTGDVAAQLDELAGHPAVGLLRGIRHLAHVDADPDWLGRDDVAAGVAELGRRGIAFDLVVRPWQLGQATALARRVPGTRLVLDHLGNPPLDAEAEADWRAGVAALAACEHVSAKVSGLVSGGDADAAAPERLDRAFDAALAAFGPGRLMYGSDWPLVRLAADGYRGWFVEYLRLTAPLSAAERDAVDAGSARTAYGIAR
ncbi:amidohydrolase family protein [Agromyces sp. NPDC058104]|uniref:amidohydrolase family protein n=1 Tax=Agromyces sp. NPDC058104 TaxID=3346342 RepID=UPI0036DCB3D7